jgi:hypothetical protein
MSDNTNPPDAEWFITDQAMKVADTISVVVMDQENCVRIMFGQSVGNAVVEVATFIVQRDVAEAFGGSLLSLGNKPRPGE